MSAHEPILLAGEEATLAAGRALGEAAIPGDVLALVGDLGAGKTTLAKGIALGLGVGEVVVSPTFNLLRTYEGRLRLHHLDLYRLGDVDELIELGLPDLLDEGAVTVLEWADRFPEVLPAHAGWIHLDLPDADHRALRLSGDPQVVQRLAGALARGRAP